VVAFRNNVRIAIPPTRAAGRAKSISFRKGTGKSVNSWRSESKATIQTGQSGFVYRDMAMPSDVIRSAPLNVLVVLADTGLSVAQMLPALKPHYALVCSSPAQSLDAARQFEPDVIMIDLRVPDATALVRDLSQTAYDRQMLFVAMSGTSESAAHPQFQYTLQIPATAGELEQLLWRIGRSLAARTPQMGRPDSEMIG